MKTELRQAEDYSVLVDGTDLGNVTRYGPTTWWACARDEVGNIYGLGNFASRKKAVGAVKAWHAWQPDVCKRLGLVEEVKKP